ncbi:signal peptide peptidase SppA [Dysgonomonas sp. 216]|uniref:signal peptide peptidase SppA n=1 Tax=Dysgonomonas sp. 216 TaxID=2302934 RepID=UPI0013CFBCFA|nr:signal peptide peptidase SppA [Dysgonomonas sp. 216]NDW19617.1 signal peptide peptidase SppA [Dysgonomonas sp. 216]
MKNFLKTLLASTVGVIIGAIIFTFLMFSFLMGIAASSGSSPYLVEDNTILKLDLNGMLYEQATESPLGTLLGEPAPLGLDDVLVAIKKAKENDKVKGIYIKSGYLESGVAGVDAIRRELMDFKKTGKFVVSYGDIYSQSGYYLASVSDKIIMNPQGMLEFQGLSTNIQFVKNFYDKIGVKYQVFKVGTFKSAVEPLIQDKMSDANRQQITSYMGNIWEHILDGVSESRNISKENLNRYADKFLLFSDPDSILSYNMIDSLLYESKVEEYLKTLVNIGKDEKLKFASVQNMVSVPVKEKNKENKIAVLFAEGSIIDDDSGSPLFQDKSITAKQYVKELNDLRDNDEVKAVVFRVNSRGGSAYASEQIWNAVKELRAKKPVIVSMGDYAASGGYYISCGANAIVAEPTTLTGSIGIFGLLPNGEELAKKMGYSYDEVNTNKHSSWGGRAFGIPFIVTALSRGLNAEESGMVQAYVERGYDYFLSRCAEGRSKTKADIDSIGQGRVWTGNQALQLGLVDKLGGINDAIELAAKTADIESYSISKYPAKKPFFEQLMESSIAETKVKVVKMFVSNEDYERSLLMKDINNLDIQMAVMPDKINF